MTSSTLAETGPLPAASHCTTKARLGAITRELHDALRALGATPELQRVLREIPDARSRLAYVGEMTEKAAHRVLGLVEDAMPALEAHGRLAQGMVDAIGRDAVPLQAGPEDAGRLMVVCGLLASSGVALAAQQKLTLSEIMMTQDFQDLSGQVIKKVIDMITRIESQLVQILLDEGEGSTPTVSPDASLQGPQTPDIALAQDDVDDLLAAMGF